MALFFGVLAEMKTRDAPITFFATDHLLAKPMPVICVSVFLIQQLLQ